MNSPPVGFPFAQKPPPPREHHRRRVRPTRTRVEPPEVNVARAVANLAGFAAQSAQAPDPVEPRGQSGHRLTHHSARARLMLGVRRLYRRIKPMVAPVLQRIAHNLRGFLD